MEGEEAVEIQAFPPDLFYECHAAGEQVEQVEKIGHDDAGVLEPRNVPSVLRVLSVSVPVVVRHHREIPGRGTLEVGTVSAGSLDLALNILTHLYPPNLGNREPFRCRVNLTSQTAYALHKRFCAEFLAQISQGEQRGGEGKKEIPISSIRSWVLRHTQTSGE